MPAASQSTTTPPKNGPIRKSSSSPFLVRLIQPSIATKSNSTGAFTPTCSANHLPGYIKSLPQLKEKGVQIVAVLASNDPFVMSAWGKANQVTGDDIVCNPTA
jgi:alkyl hydroperoxide reductase 1